LEKNEFEEEEKGKCGSGNSFAAYYENMKY